MKQGCPLSPILFNIALEGLLRHLTSQDAGYAIAGSTFNSLAYADDIAIIASNKSEMQFLLDKCVEFTEWARLSFNAKKCGSLCWMNRRTPIYVDPEFSPHLGSDTIPALSWEQRYKYLGCPTGAENSSDLSTLRADLLKDATTIFQSPLAEWQKLDVFRRFLFPRASFVLKVIFPGTTWCRKLDTSLRSIIKKGLRIPHRTCTDYFYLPQSLGGMGIPNIQEEAHVAKAAQVFKFLSDERDPTLRSVAIDQLSQTVKKRAPNLDPSSMEDLTTFLNKPPEVREGRAGDMRSLWNTARASLALANATLKMSANTATLHTARRQIGWHQRKLASQLLKEGVGSHRLSSIKSHPDQGRAFDSLSLHPDSTFFYIYWCFHVFSTIQVCPQSSP